MQKARYVVHVDMDAFFAAIEQRDNPALHNKPVVVGADPKGGKGRGVVSTCSYEARKFGIHSAMPISIAYQKCPQAVFLPVNMEKYLRVSNQIFKILYDFTPDLEPISIDEAFLDITGSFHLFGSPFEVCKLIKSRIKNEIALTASIGLAPIKMAAKIASDLNKPDGLVEVTKEGLLGFLWPLDLDKIWGLGEKTKVIFGKIGIETIGDLAGRDARELMQILGKNGLHFWQLANGIDQREVKPENEAKSISNEITFEKDTSDRQRIEAVLLRLCEKISDRLRGDRLKGRTITLKIRIAGFHTYTRTITIEKATNFVDVIFRQIKKLYDNFRKDAQKVRLVGVKVSNFIPADFPDTLFKEGDEEAQEKLHKAIDRIKEKFGDSAIHRAGDNML